MSKLARAERIDLRISSELKRLIEQAAALSGVSVSSFITETAVRRSARGHPGGSDDHPLEPGSRHLPGDAGR